MRVVLRLRVPPALAAALRGLALAPVLEADEPAVLALVPVDREEVVPPPDELADLRAPDAAPPDAPALARVDVLVPVPLLAVPDLARVEVLRDAAEDLRALPDAEPELPELPELLPESPPAPNNRRTASVAAVTIAAPILLALSAAESAASCASLPASTTVARTFLLAVKAAAAVTRPAASMLRATGFWASSAALSPASRSALDMAEDLFFFDPPSLLDLFLGAFEPPEDFDLAIAVSSLVCNSSVTDVRLGEQFPKSGPGQLGQIPVS